MPSYIPHHHHACIHIHKINLSLCNSIMFLTDNKLLKSLMSCEPESLYALSDIPVSETEFLTISTLADLYDRELVSTIGWAKQIPGAVPSYFSGANVVPAKKTLIEPNSTPHFAKILSYNMATVQHLFISSLLLTFFLPTHLHSFLLFLSGFSELALNDQMRLLQSTWGEILTLGLAYRSMPAHAHTLHFAPDFPLDEKQARECNATELFTQVCKSEKIIYNTVHSYRKVVHDTSIPKIQNNNITFIRNWLILQ